MARYKEVYKKREWLRVREAVICRDQGLCVECLKVGKFTAGKIIHHVKFLDDNNKDDWKIAYNVDNLVLLCNECHEKVHHRVSDLYNFTKPI